jgi:hypothetical protein
MYPELTDPEVNHMIEKVFDWDRQLSGRSERLKSGEGSWH